MALFGSGADDHHFGFISALVLNLSLVGLPFAAVSTWHALQDPNVYGYAVTPAAKEHTQRALEKAAASLAPPNADQHATWNSLIQRELDESDYAAATGFLLCAPAMLEPSEAARLEAQLPPNADDRTRAQAALVFIDDNLRKQFEAGGGVQLAAGVPSNFALLGDSSEFAQQVSHWLAGEQVDPIGLELSGIGVALATSDQRDPALVGGSLIKAARSAGKLSGPFSGYIQALLSAALPPAQLKQALLKDPKGAQDPAALAKIVQQTLNPAGVQKLRSEFLRLKAIADAVSPAGAVTLLSRADNANDIGRLQLIAASGHERAIAVAKRADGPKLLAAAQGTLKMTQELTLDFIGVGLALVGIAFGALSTLGQALLREWRHGQHLDEA